METPAGQTLSFLAVFRPLSNHPKLNQIIAHLLGELVGIQQFDIDEGVRLFEILPGKREVLFVAELLEQVPVGEGDQFVQVGIQLDFVRVRRTNRAQDETTKIDEHPLQTRLAKISNRTDVQAGHCDSFDKFYSKIFPKYKFCFQFTIKNLFSKRENPALFLQSHDSCASLFLERLP